MKFYVSGNQIFEQTFVPNKILARKLHGQLAGELSEELVTYEKRNKGWRMNCDVGEATGGFENEL